MECGIVNIVCSNVSVIEGGVTPLMENLGTLGHKEKSLSLLMRYIGEKSLAGKIGTTLTIYVLI